MKATFGTTKKGTWAYIQKSVRIGGKSTTKTHLEVRPVYHSRQDRIRSHFLVGFLALLLLKLLQKRLADSFPEAYKEHPLTGTGIRAHVPAHQPHRPTARACRCGS